MDNLEERLERIERKLDALLAHLRVSGGPPARAARPGYGGGEMTAPPANAGPEVASDADLDSPRGNPEVRFMPKRWTGADYKGRRFSECEPEFLDMLADTFEWFAQRDDDSGAVDKNGNPKSRWGRLDAARARGWAARARGGGGGAGRASASGSSGARKRSATPAPSYGDFGGGGGDGMDEDIPF